MATPPDFTTGAVLTAAQMNAVGLWKITPTVSGTGMSVVDNEVVMSDVTDGQVRLVFNSDFRHYRMIFQHNASTTLSVNMQMLSGTSTIDSTSVYRYAALGWVSNGTGYNDNSTGATDLPIGGGGQSDAGSSYKILDFMGPNVAARTWVQADWGIEWTDNLVYMRRYACLVDTATQYTGIRVFTGAGNIDGTISVYGYN
jgi:hypothetical protein